jgi:hypothetical protein
MKDIFLIHKWLNEAAKKNKQEFYPVEDLKEKLSDLLEESDSDLLKDLPKIAVILKSLSSLLIYEPINTAIQLLWRLKSLSRMIANPSRINIGTFRNRLREIFEYINEVNFNENNSKLAAYHKP